MCGLYSRGMRSVDDCASHRTISRSGHSRGPQPYANRRLTAYTNGDNDSNGNSHVDYHTNRHPHPAADCYGYSYTRTAERSHRSCCSP